MSTLSDTLNVCTDDLEKKRFLILSMLESKIGINCLLKNFGTIITDDDFEVFEILPEILNSISDLPKGRKLIVEYFPYLLSSCPDSDMEQLISIVSSTHGGMATLRKYKERIFDHASAETSTTILKYFDLKTIHIIQKENSYVYHLFYKHLVSKSTLGVCLKVKGLSETLELLVKELSNNNLCSLRNVGCGMYSSCLSTNGYVIKIGENRENENIPYHPLILQPVLRHEEKNYDGDFNAIIEVQPEVETVNVKKYHVDFLVEEFRKDGILWNDAHIGNIGILKTPNRKKLPDHIAGIVNTKKIPEKEVPPGVPVVIDTDCLSYHR